MPDMNLGQLMSNATTLAGGRLDWGLSEASFWVNMAAEVVGQIVPHSLKQALAYSSTTSGENRIGVPTDYDYGLALSNLSIQDANERTLEKRDAPWFDSQSTTRGTPLYWADYGSWVELYPPPDSSYSLLLRYQIKTPTLVNSSDTLPFRPPWQTATMLKAAEYLEASRNNLEGEAVASQRYLAFVSALPNDRSLLQQRAKVGMGVRFARKGNEG